MDLIRSIHWKEAEIDLEAWRGENVEVSLLPAGLEAEVYLVSTADSTYVLKVWNRHSRPNVALQYAVLKHLYQHGAAVSKPYGWGLDMHGHQVLLTSYDGKPIRRLDGDVIRTIARMLTEVHQIDPQTMANLALPRHDLIAYFFPGVEQQPDILKLLLGLMQHIQVNHTHIIHGDYNLNNILDDEGRLTIIDWTNIQLGDARYDIAWSIVLVRIYVNDKYPRQYRSEFNNITPIDDNEYEVFEAIACLRWMLLERLGYLHYDDRIRRHVASIVRGNRFLDASLMASNHRK